MSKIDIDIYMNNFTGFFKKNPDQLNILIGKIEPELFFSEIKKLTEKNLEDDKEIAPTRTQIIELLIKLNINKTESELSKVVKPFMEHHMGKINLN